MLGPVLISVHNMRFYQRLMHEIRQAIARGDFEAFARTDPRCRIGPGVGTVQSAADDLEEAREEERDNA
jgi:hypothetical protein